MLYQCFTSKTTMSALPHHSHHVTNAFRSPTTPYHLHNALSFYFKKNGTLKHERTLLKKTETPTYTKNAKSKNEYVKTNYNDNKCYTNNQPLLANYRHMQLFL